MTYFRLLVTLRYSLSIRRIFFSAFASHYTLFVLFPTPIIILHLFSAFLISSTVYRITVVSLLTCFSIFVSFILSCLFSYLLSVFFTARRIFSSTSLRMNESLRPVARLFSSASRSLSLNSPRMFLFFPGPWIRGDGGTVQRCPEEARFAVAPDLPRAQHCLQGRPAAVLLRALLPPTLPGTRSTYTRLDYLHKRDRALVLLPFSSIATRSVSLSAGPGWSDDRAECRVQRAGRRWPAASSGCELVQSVQRDQGVSQG